MGTLIRYDIYRESIICACWAAGLVVGLLPVLGWHQGAGQDARCVFDEIMDHGYLVFVYFATIVAPVLLLAFFYAHIYQVVRKQVLSPTAGSVPLVFSSMHSFQQQRDVRTAQQLAVIVAFFALCWLPLYTLNCVQAFRPSWRPPSAALNACIVLSHLNSAGNPLLYAYHLRDFRAAFRSLLLPAAFERQKGKRKRR
ncbi:adenosine receptor A2a [Schistocerca nitens]|uniref:adenosine receptor A2a n=1 Tax=Schistocerca nitens TaxID=7011 RepID=UPI002118D18B|nr:adenosine receptor A2a [Schistocerca nitens]